MVGLTIINKSNYLNRGFFLLSLLSYILCLSFLLLGGSLWTWRSSRAEESLFKCNLYGSVKHCSLLSPCICSPSHLPQLIEHCVSEAKGAWSLSNFGECIKVLWKPIKGQVRSSVILHPPILFKLFSNHPCCKYLWPRRVFQVEARAKQKMWLNLKIFRGKKCVDCYSKMPKHH